MKVLITGHSGYIGSHVFKLLSDKGLEVAGLGRQEVHGGQFQEFIFDGTAASVERAYALFKPEATIHCAASFSSSSVDDIKSLVDVNVAYGAMLLEACVNNSCTKFINAGSYFEYFGSNGDLSPCNAYAASKSAFQILLEFYGRERNLSALTLVLYDVYGPRDPRPKLLNKLILGNPGDISPGKQLKDFIFIDDVAEAFYLALTSLENLNEVRYFVRTNVLTSIEDLVRIIDEKMKSSLYVHLGKRPYADNEIMKPYLGPILPYWKPKVSINDGIDRVLEDNRCL